MGVLTPAAYALGQAVRVGWYLTLYRAAQRLSPRMPPTVPPPGGWPSMRSLVTDLAQLMRRDLADIRAGRQPLPADLAPNPARMLAEARAFFADLPAVIHRRRTRTAQEPFKPETRGRYPRYWLQNFHYQTDGWLSPESARLYDLQVETLFIGAADTMRRRAIPPLVAALADRRSPLLVEIGCGTARGLIAAHRAIPGLTSVGVDLSHAYLGAARDGLAPVTTPRVTVALAERLPLADASVDAVLSVFMFHELPRAVRAKVAAEIRRVLKPDGVAVIVDSLQLGDHPPYDPLIRRFPVTFHEPYYLDWVGQDAPRLFGEAGLTVRETERAFFAKLFVLTPAI